MTGVFPITWTFDTVGPFARSVADVGLMFSVLAGYDPRDTRSTDEPLDDYLATQGESLEGIRIGLPDDFYFVDVDDEIVEAVRAAAKVLEELGATLVAIDVPNAAQAVEATRPMIRSEAYAIHRQRLAEQPELFGEDVRRALLLGADISGATYGECRQFAREWKRLLHEVFGRVDLVLTPTTGIPAPRAAEIEVLEITQRLTRLVYGWTLAGLPVLACPCGFSSSGLPLGFQLAAASFREATLLRAGKAYQERTTWHLAAPPLEPVD